MKFLSNHWTHPPLWDPLLLHLLLPAVINPHLAMVMAIILVVDMDEEVVTLNVTALSVVRFVVRKDTMLLFTVSATPALLMLPMLPI